MRSEQGSSSQQQMKTMRGERYNGVRVPEKEQVRSDEESCGEGPHTIIIHEVHNSPFEWHYKFITYRKTKVVAKATKGPFLITVTKYTWFAENKTIVCMIMQGYCPPNTDRMHAW